MYTASDVYRRLGNRELALQQAQQSKQMSILSIFLGIGLWIGLGFYINWRIELIRELEDSLPTDPYPFPDPDPFPTWDPIPIFPTPWNA